MYLSHFEIYLGNLMAWFLNMNFVDTNVVLPYRQPATEAGGKLGKGASWRLFNFECLLVL